MAGEKTVDFWSDVAFRTRDFCVLHSRLSIMVRYVLNDLWFQKRVERRILRPRIPEALSFLLECQLYLVYLNSKMGAENSDERR